MTKSKAILAAGVLGVSVAFAAPAWAFDCNNTFADTEAAIAKATAAMKTIKDKTVQGLAHTLIDDAKTLLESGKHNHNKSAAGRFDHARAVAKGRSAKGYAEAALMYANANQ